MRSVALVPLMMLVACSWGPAGSYDPNLYDAKGNVVTPVAEAQPVIVPAPLPPPPPECREVQTNVTIGGKPAQTTSMACRQGDGSWRLVN
jgi:surface antigen